MQGRLLFFILAIVWSVTLCATEPIKILAIGNSFSEDALESFFVDIAKADDVDVIVGNAMIGGASLELHWDNALSDSMCYIYKKNVDGVMTRSTNRRLSDILVDEEWDFISFQQASKYSGMYDTYFPYLRKLKTYVESIVLNQDVQYALHMPWAYAQSSDHSGFLNYNKDQLTMYSAIVETVFKVAEKMNIDIVIPSGTAIQNGRSTIIGDNFCRDGFHLSLDKGRYLAACTWYEKLIGKCVVGNFFVPDGLIEEEIYLIQQSAHAAVKQPQKVSDFVSLNIGVQ